MQNNKTTSATQFNGWSTLATRVVYNDLFADMAAADFVSDIENCDRLVNELEEALAEHAYIAVESDASCLAQKYAHMFFNGVNFREIADYMYEKYMATASMWRQNKVHAKKQKAQQFAELLYDEVYLGNVSEAVGLRLMAGAYSLTEDEAKDIFAQVDMSF